MKSLNIGLAVLMMTYFLPFEPADEQKYSLEYFSSRVHVSYDSATDLIRKYSARNIF